MLALDIHLDGDACWPDLAAIKARGDLIDLMDGDARIGVALLRGGMQSGSGSVTIRIDLPDGKVVLTQTSLALLSAAMKAMNIRMRQ